MKLSTPSVLVSGAAVLAVGVTLLAAPLLSAPTPPPPAPSIPAWALTQCPTEDSTNCRWDDGTGYGFIVREVPPLVCTYYLDLAYATTHDACVVRR